VRTVASLVHQRHVVRTPQGLERGHAEHEDSTRLQNAAYLREGRRVVRNVLQDVECDHSVDCARGERDALASPNDQVVQIATSTKTQREWTHVEAHRASPFRKLSEDDAGAASEIKHLWKGRGTRDEGRGIGWVGVWNAGRGRGDACGAVVRGKGLGVGEALSAGSGVERRTREGETPVAPWYAVRGWV